MIRFAFPKSRNSGAAQKALAAAGVELPELDVGSRRLRHRFPEQGVEVLLIKDWDLPLYVERGVADCGVVGSDVLGEVDGDLLVPLRLPWGCARLSLIGLPPGDAPQPGSQVRVGTKYPCAAARLLARSPWGAEVLPLSGSVELAPLLGLADYALDIVQTGATLAAHQLIEVQIVEEVAPCVVINRGSFHRHREVLGPLLDRLEDACAAPAERTRREERVG